MPIQDYLADIDSYTGGAKAEMDSANRAYADTAGAGQNLAGKLKEALNTKLNNNADLIEQKNAAMADYFAAPANARAEYQGIWNPFEREKLVANARTQAYKPYATFSDILTNRMGQVSDIVGEGVQGWQYVIQQAKAMADAASQKYQNLMGEYMSAAGMQEKADAAAEQQRQYNETMAWDKSKFAQQQASKGGSGSKGNSGKTADAWREIVAEATERAANGERGGSAVDVMWDIINRDQGALRNDGVDVNQLWAWQKNLWPAQQPQQQQAASWTSALNWNPYKKEVTLNPITSIPSGLTIDSTKFSL